MSTIQPMLDYTDDIAGWFAGLGRTHVDSGELEQALEYTAIAASILCRQNRTLTHLQVEENMLQAAARLFGADDMRWQKPAEETCLHVASEVLPAGGLTSMITRWVGNDSSGRRHSLAVLHPKAPVPPELLEAIAKRGGKVFLAPADSGLVERARWLRKLAFENASHVVLHVDTSDVICGAAFGVPEGPPVMLVNHAAHIFWTGASIIDAVLNCRGSDLEGVWASAHRGIRRHATLPIPLPIPALSTANDSAPREKQREAARAELGIPSDAIVFLTVGASFKYLPVDGLDFVQACERVLDALPNAFVLTAGFAGDDRWQTAAVRTGNRIRTLGRLSQDRLAVVRSASDIYLEGFPFGTTTSLLESAMCGMPVVLAPATCPPPYGSDGIALDDILKRPQTAAEYAEWAIRLGRDPEARRCDGEVVRRSVIEHHTGDGWKGHLESVFRVLPAKHAVFRPGPVMPTPPVIHEHWSRFLPRWTWGYEHTLENGLLHAYANRLKPRLDGGVMDACRRGESVRRGRTIPLPILRILCNYVLVLVPAPLDRLLYRAIFSLCHGSLLGRIRKRTARFLGLAEKRRGAYEEYRQVKVTRS